MNLRTKRATLLSLSFLVILIITMTTLFVIDPHTVFGGHSAKSGGATSGVSSGATTLPESKATSTSVPPLPIPNVYTSLTNGDITMLNRAVNPHLYTNLPPTADSPNSFNTDLQRSGDLLYVHTVDPNADNIVALNSSSGAKVWSYRQGIECTVQNVPFLTSNQLIDDVYFVTNSNASGTTNCSWADQYVVALDAKTGKTLWTAPHESFLGESNHIALIYDGVSIRAMNAITGALLWHLYPGSIIHYLVSQQILYLSGGPILAIDMKSGTILWDYAIASETYLEVAIDNDVIVLDPVSNGSGIFFIRLHNGNIVWKIPGSFEGHSIDSSMQLSGTHLVKITRNAGEPLVYDIDKETGVVKGQYTSSNKQVSDVCWDKDLNTSRGYFVPQIDVFGRTSMEASKIPLSIEAVDVGVSSTPTWTQQLQGQITSCYAYKDFLTISTYDHTVLDTTPQSGPPGSGPIYTAVGPFYTYLMNAHDGSIIWKRATSTWAVSSIIDIVGA